MPGYPYTANIVHAFSTATDLGASKDVRTLLNPLQRCTSSFLFTLLQTHQPLPPIIPPPPPPPPPPPIPQIPNVFHTPSLAKWLFIYSR
ncbi:hypothetical protein K470DRAFT_114878 [Piedraia hortae CBS 480.64]|uniref:Uncharacterized protein n=1 Tax=Piedraia hortae CBS 480.64 TaxID=1314780 RepID=A0A6A7BUD8_9PEZI|nr:hypothetical protein K470DRAFT_114878 [Piedraia hortae CBS 480.64]